MIYLMRSYKHEILCMKLIQQSKKIKSMIYGMIYHLLLKFTYILNLNKLLDKIIKIPIKNEI